MSEAPLLLRNFLFAARRNAISGGAVYVLDVLQRLERMQFTHLMVLPLSGPFGEALSELGVETPSLGLDDGWLQPRAPWHGFLSGFGSRVCLLVGLIHRCGAALVDRSAQQAAALVDRSAQQVGFDIGGR